jgi:recombination protein RecT
MPDNAPAQQGGTAVARRETSDVGQFKRQLEARARDIQMALPAHISQDKFQRTILTAVAQNPDLLKADRDSLVLACYKAAQDGLLPDGREAALVTFNTRFKDATTASGRARSSSSTPRWSTGLRKKVLQSGEIVDLFASVVFKQEIEAGRFIYEEGTERMLRHKPILEPDFSPTDDDIAIAYSVATFKDGSKSFEVMFRRDINKVRQCSQTGAVGKTDRQGRRRSIRPRAHGSNGLRSRRRRARSAGTPRPCR